MDARMKNNIAIAALSLSFLSFADGVHSAPIVLRAQGAAIPNGASSDVVISPNGRTVIFRSQATNLAIGNGMLFSYAVGSGQLQALAPGSAGTVITPSASKDGRFLAFATSATGLAEGADSDFNDVLRLDNQRGTFSRASQGFGETKANAGSNSSSISGDGRMIAFTSEATNLLSSPTPVGVPHVFAMNMDTRQIAMMSATASGTPANGPSSALEPNAFSGSGERLVFTTNASNLATVQPGTANVIVRHNTGGIVSFENVNRSVSGTPGNLSASSASISANGRFVVFRSSATNLVHNGPNDSDLFVRDLDFNTLQAVPMPSGHANCTRGRVDNDGSVAMQCDEIATNRSQVFLAPPSAVPQLLSAAFNAAGGGNASSGQTLSLSAEGRVVAFTSAASNLVPDDENTQIDVFISAEAAEFTRIFSDGIEGSPQQPTAPQ